MSVSFIKAINQVDFKNIVDLEAINNALEERYSVLELQEPNSDYEFYYEKWEEKFTEFEYLKNDFDMFFEQLTELLLNENEDMKENIDKDKLEELKNDYNEWKSNVKMYQLEYGGLKRLKVYI